MKINTLVLDGTVLKPCDQDQSRISPGKFLKDSLNWFYILNFPLTTVRKKP